nr:ABC-three component system protein [uncultured Pedobacter sp.]
MTDLAPGPISGYLFQFEKALAILAGLENSQDSISIEKIDDIAIHNENDVTIVAVQAKHSISPNGTMFEDTSKSLWRTIEIWIQKLENGTLDNTTSFLCVTNKKISNDYLIRKFKTEELSATIQLVQDLLEEQKIKLKEVLKKDKNAGPSIKQTIKRIEFALSKPTEFETVISNLEIRDGDDPKQSFFVEIHMANKEYTDSARQQAFQSMYGWITDTSKSKWKNNSHATFTKSEFESRFALVFSSPTLVNAVFRKKNLLGSIGTDTIDEKRQELFVKQIQDIKRKSDAKERKIEDAIINFICYDIELAHIIAKNGNLTLTDFEEFKAACLEKWQTCYDSFVTKELDEYNDDDKNALAISIFDSIMDKIEVKFQHGIEFSSDNKYIYNGTFLKLSNVPAIGWHPEWEKKYKN